MGRKTYFFRSSYLTAKTIAFWSGLIQILIYMNIICLDKIEMQFAATNVRLFKEKQFSVIFTLVDCKKERRVSWFGIQLLHVLPGWFTWFPHQNFWTKFKFFKNLLGEQTNVITAKTWNRKTSPRTQQNLELTLCQEQIPKNKKRKNKQKKNYGKFLKHQTGKGMPNFKWNLWQAGSENIFKSSCKFKKIKIYIIYQIWF